MSDLARVIQEDDSKWQAVHRHQIHLVLLTRCLESLTKTKRSEQMWNYRGVSRPVVLLVFRKCLEARRPFRILEH